MRRLLAMLALLLPGFVPGVAGASDCTVERFEGIAFTTCTAGPEDELRLFLQDKDGATFGNFRAINRHLATQGKQLGFAMNAGMYHRDLSPVGLHVEESREISPIVTREGPGNFGMLPNGVFCWGKEGYRITDARRFEPLRKGCRFATQSGPMLVIKGALHPRFLADSDSRYIRNGVGVSQDGQRAVFAISERPVNFHRFARFFRDHLGLPDALYFDGNISRLHAPSLRRSDGGFPMGPIVGIVIDKE